MKLQHVAFLVAGLLPDALGLDAPIEGYGVVVPEWEIEVTPGGPIAVLNGTVEKIHEELLQLNPNWDEEYISNSTDTTGGASKRDSDSHLFSRTDFRGSKYTCRGRWPECHPNPIRRGIEYLRYVQGRPRNGPGPGNCGRVSCSYNAAIWWCNDNTSAKTLAGFGSIADGAEYIVDNCMRWHWVKGGYVSAVAGQVFHKTKWNVIVRKDKC
ncbi:hypothetical protein B0J15DRAFT_538988 [Fusarium solani]|uniref:Uncharacterized protein n=1 Tax=Fusarium solani TaxID=169388 RepID=A0A9P9JZA4_FUSSL|nr:uncharacterized protein B0J15DRAFT_538988 [Fusarium solani]KAH7234329.1 hypothetical protein B0J15DRAFT_538988 [Fusarium solani]